MSEPLLYRPTWTLPAGVHAFVTTRNGGHSAGAWNSFNLARHAGDDAAAVDSNRSLLLQAIRAETDVPVPGIQWLSQVHGMRVFHAGALPLPAPQADAIYGRETPLVLGILTADCLPVLFAADDGTEIAAAHAGWRGLLGGVLEATLGSFHARPSAVSAWLGPAIGPCHFEVGAEVRAAFLADAKPGLRAAVDAAFAPAASPGKWMADLYALARHRLHSAGLARVYGSPSCTVCNHERFYSYRKAPVTGRFATLIVRTP